MTLSSFRAAVPLNDGRNDKSTGLTLDQLLDRIKVTAAAEPVRVFTFAYAASDEDAIAIPEPLATV